MLNRSIKLYLTLALMLIQAQPSWAILNGANTDEEVFHHAIAYIDTGMSHCSGLLVAPNVVLTAAHCIGPTGTEGSTNDVWFDSEQSELRHRVGKFFSDPTFIEVPASKQKENDYALGILNEILVPTEATPISVYLKPLQVNEKVILAGYGANNDATFAGLDYANADDKVRIDEWTRLHPGNLYSGLAHASLFQGSYVGLSSANEAALAPGDSGSSLLTKINEVWFSRGIATRAGPFKDKDGIEKNVSIFVPVANLRFLEFIKLVQTTHKIKICGIDLVCSN